jgi:hypothetical protein
VLLYDGEDFAESSTNLSRLVTPRYQVLVPVLVYYLYPLAKGSSRVETQRLYSNTFVMYPRPRWDDK